VKRLKTGLLILGFSLIALLLTGEAYIRWRFSENFTPVSSRYLHPYLGFGEFRIISRLQRPEDHGYELVNGVYIFQNQREVNSSLDRFPNLLEIYDGRPLVGLSDPKNLAFVMGGSAALGDGAKIHENRFPFLLQSKLRSLANNQNVQVVPAAMRAFVTTQERISLELYLFPARPKAIFFLHGYNDFAQLEYMARPGDPYNMTVEYSRSENSGFRLLQALGDWSRFIRWLHKNRTEETILAANRNLQKDPQQVRQYLQSVANIYLENLFWVANRCEQNKVQCFFVLQPIPP
jgi:hypothetical protein